MYPTIDPKATGLRLRRIMNQRELTVKDIQKYLNLSSVQSIYHWLNGQSVPSVDHLYALSELFRLPVDAIIAGNRTYHMPLSDRSSFYHRLYVYYMTTEELRARKT